MFGSKTRLKRQIRSFLHILVCAAIGYVLVYPLLWMLFASFKDNGEIYNNSALFPRGDWVWTAFRDGWKGVGDANFGVFMKNSFLVTVPSVIFTIISSALTAYGFARFQFVGKKVFFMLMLATLMLPNAVIMVPTYVLFRDLNWLNTYKPMVVPTLFASSSFIIFMLVQFFRNLPKEMDEAARIDGCNAMMILIRILTPLCAPALISAGLFQFMWKWNDYFSVLIYINSVKKYTAALGLRMSLDSTTGVQWNQIMAMSVVSILPCVLIFFALQKYFVEGIATSGIKG